MLFLRAFIALIRLTKPCVILIFIILIFRLPCGRRLSTRFGTLQQALWTREFWFWLLFWLGFLNFPSLLESLAWIVAIPHKFCTFSSAVQAFYAWAQLLLPFISVCLPFATQAFLLPFSQCQHPVLPPKKWGIPKYNIDRGSKGGFSRSNGVFPLLFVHRAFWNLLD